MQEVRKPRLLIIGSKGFIGQHIIKDAQGTWEALPADCQAGPDDPETIPLDITNAESVRKVFKDARPDAVILLAAMSDIDRCEENPERARLVNVQGPENVATSCEEAGARLLFASSAAVFDGTKHAYKEEDEPHPLSVYGRTKLEAESTISKILPAAVIIRLALVLGFSRSQGTNAFLNRLEQSLHSGKTVRAPADEYRNPIDVSTLSRAIIQLVQISNTSGVYHLGSLDSLSRYEMTRQLAAGMGFKDSQVVPHIGQQPGRALRGKNHLLLTGRIRQACDITFGTAHDVIRRSLDGFAESSL